MLGHGLMRRLLIPVLMLVVGLSAMGPLWAQELPECNWSGALDLVFRDSSYGRCFSVTGVPGECKSVAARFLPLDSLDVEPDDWDAVDVLNDSMLNTAEIECASADLLTEPTEADEVVIPPDDPDSAARRPDELMRIPIVPRPTPLPCNRPEALDEAAKHLCCLIDRSRSYCERCRDTYNDEGLICMNGNHRSCCRLGSTCTGNTDIPRQAQCAPLDNPGGLNVRPSDPPEFAGLPPIPVWWDNTLVPSFVFERLACIACKAAGGVPSICYGIGTRICQAAFPGLPLAQKRCLEFMVTACESCQSLGSACR